MSKKKKCEPEQAEPEQVDEADIDDQIDQCIQILKSLSKEQASFLVESLKQKIEQAEDVAEQPTIDQQTQERIKRFYKNLEPRTKLAIATLFEVQALDGINFQFREKEGRLYEQIWSELQSTCIETFHREPDEDIPFGINDTEDIWLCGIWEAARMVVQNC